jgi:hypothetical protein
MDGFHWNEGMYFKRTADGAVEITQTQGGGQSEEVEWQRTIPPSEWASIVASVSAAGETGETYRAALAFHKGDK